MSDTPRTDEAELSLLDIQNGHGPSPYVPAELARRLERELDGALHAERVLYRQLTEARAVTYALQKELEEAIFEAARALWRDSRFSESEKLQKAFSNLQAQGPSKPDSKDGQNG